MVVRLGVRAFRSSLSRSPGFFGLAFLHTSFKLFVNIDFFLVRTFFLCLVLVSGLFPSLQGSAMTMACFFPLHQRGFFSFLGSLAVPVSREKVPLVVFKFVGATIEL